MIKNFTKPITNLSLGGCFLALLLMFANTPTYSQNSKVEEAIQLAAKEKPAQLKPGELPSTPNPFLSLIPPGEIADYKTWINFQKTKIESASGRRTTAGRVITINERENNDTQSRAQEIDDFGTSDGDDDDDDDGDDDDGDDDDDDDGDDDDDESSQVFINGASGGELNVTTGTASEDDGAIQSANATGISQLFESVSVNSTLGDGPIPGFDFDFYQLDATAGANIIMDINTPFPFDDLDPVVSIFDANGQVLDFNDDDGSTRDSFLNFTVPADGSYFVCVGGWPAFFPANPFDSQGGSVTGLPGSEGDYELRVSLVEFSDIDFYEFELEEGDVFGAAINGEIGSARLTVNDPNGDLRVSTNLNTTFYPIENPLPTNGVTTVSFIAPEEGDYAISVSENVGNYQLELFVTRPGNEVNKGNKQVIYLDYNGSDFDPCAFLEIGCSIPSFLSPLRDFLPAWGLPNDDASVRRITNRITKVVKENLRRDLRKSELNDEFDVEIRSNDGLDGPDEGSVSTPGRPVSRVIVGGTIPEAFISTIGIAQSIDLGNFRTEEDAIVLLDILSSPASGFNANFTFSLNDVTLAPGVSKEDLVVTALGNITAHEAGHYLGNWHNDGLSETQVIMDEGPGGLFNLIGVGPSGVFGGSDQTDVDFGTDDYSNFEFFTGVENTQANTAFALSFISQDDDGRSAIDLADNTSLSQTYPNPASVNTIIPISFRLPVGGQVKVEVFNLSGIKLMTLYDGMVEKDKEYKVSVNPNKHRLESGMYIYKLITPYGATSKKFLLVDN